MAVQVGEFDFSVGTSGSPGEFRAAAEAGDLTRLNELICQVSFIDCSDTEGHSALYMAARAGQAAAAELLIGAGASVNGPVNKAGPLHAAAAAGHTTLVKLLMESGADAQRVDDAGKTPLHLAEEGGHAACKDALCSDDQS